MSPLRLLLLFIAAECMLCVGITIRGSALQRVYNPFNPEAVELYCLHSNQSLINQGVTWTRNGIEISHTNPLILDPNTLGDDPQHHEGKYSCIYETSQSNNEVAVYGELQDGSSEAMFTTTF